MAASGRMWQQNSEQKTGCKEKDKSQGRKVRKMMKKNLKRILVLGMTVCLMLGTPALSGCKKSKKDIVSVISDLKAKTEDGKHHLQGNVSSFDGKELKYTSFHGEMKSFVAELSKIKYENCNDWDPGKVTYPIYHFELETFDSSFADKEMTMEDMAASTSFWGAFWSNGYLVTSEGDAYKCSFDFAAVTKDMEDLVTFGSEIELMQVYERMSALWNGKWYKENMQTLDEYLACTYDGEQTISKADGWNAKFKSRKNNEVTITLKNTDCEGNGDDWPGIGYGKHFGPVFVKIDGTWYRVPWDVSLGNVAYTTEGSTLVKGAGDDVTSVVGYLPKGEYAAYVNVAKNTGVFEYDLAEFTV